LIYVHVRMNAAVQFAICLPFETEGALSLTYVVFLMLINGVAFSILMGCYLKVRI
jgi:leucine-rich repeat-containing G protein-coupled receptor 6